MAVARPTYSKRATSWVCVPGGDTPIEANIGLLSSAAHSLRKRNTWVRGALPANTIHLKRSRLQVVP